MNENSFLTNGTVTRSFMLDDEIIERLLSERKGDQNFFQKFGRFIKNLGSKIFGGRVAVRVGTVDSKLVLSASGKQQDVENFESFLQRKRPAIVRAAAIIAAVSDTATEAAEHRATFIRSLEASMGTTYETDSEIRALVASLDDALSMPPAELLDEFKRTRRVGNITNVVRSRIEESIDSLQAESLHASSSEEKVSR